MRNTLNIYVPVDLMESIRRRRERDPEFNISEAACRGIHAAIMGIEDPALDKASELLKAAQWHLEMARLNRRR